MIVFDTRMMSRAEGGVGTHNVTSFEPEGGIRQVAWCIDSTTEKCSLAVGTGLGRLEYWDIDVGGGGTNSSSSSSSSTSSTSQHNHPGGGGLKSTRIASLTSQPDGAAVIDEESMLLATPTGRGMVVCSRGKTTTEQSLRLQGCPRDSLRSFFSPPEPRTTRVLDYGPSLHLASIQSDTVLGMRWGTPGRLIPPSHGGLELLVLTESALITAVRLPQDVVRKYCFTGSSGSSSGLSALQTIGGERGVNGAVGGGRTERSVAGGGGATSGSHGGDNEKRDFEKIDAPIGPLLLAAPRYSVNELRQSVKQGVGAGLLSSENALRLQISSALPSSEGGSASLKLSSSSRGNTDSSPSLASNGQGAATGDRFWTGIQNEVLALEDAVQQGLLAGLSIGRIDQYARQITLEVEIARQDDGRYSVSTPQSNSFPRSFSSSPSNSPLSNYSTTPLSPTTRFSTPGSGNYRDRKSRSGSKETSYSNKEERLLSLIVRFPTRGVPSFALRGLEGPAESAAGTALVAELDATAQAFNNDLTSKSNSLLPARKLGLAGVDDDAGFLLAIARCFRNRCSQPLVPPEQTPRVMTSSFEGGDGKTALASSDIAAAMTDIIDPLAYRVPSPACSGICWSSRGVLVCFGGAVLTLPCTAEQEKGKDLTESAVHFPNYPKSLADMLIQERNREEASFQYAQHVGIERDRKDAGTRQGGAVKERKTQRKNLRFQFNDSGSEDEDEDDEVSSSSGSDEQFDENSISSGDEGFGNENRFRKKGGALAEGSGSGGGNSRTGSGSVARYLGLDEHTLPLAHAGQTLESLGEDLDLLAKASARAAGLRKPSPSSSAADRAFWMAMATAGPMSNAPSHVTLFQATSRLPNILADHYLLSPPISICSSENGNGDSDDSTNILLYFADSIRARAVACRQNAKIAETVSLKSSYPHFAQQTWSLLAVSMDLLAEAHDHADNKGNNEVMLRWSQSVLGQDLLRRLLFMLATSHELQLLATFVCILGGSTQTVALLEQTKPSVAVSEDLVSFRRFLDRVLATYSDILSRWGHLSQALDVNSSRSDIEPDQAECNASMVVAGVNCHRCGEHANGDAWWCDVCNGHAVICSVCEVFVKGVGVFCSACGHGGHSAHMKMWFENSDECPRGCGCRCVTEAIGISFRKNDHATYESDSSSESSASSEETEDVEADENDDEEEGDKDEDEEEDDDNDDDEEEEEEEEEEINGVLELKQAFS